MTSTLSQGARAVLDKYLKLPLPGVEISCPYYNNDRQRVRMGLRAQIGKGSPEEIADEALLYSLREKFDIAKMSGDEKKAFLVDHNLGIDCSGLCYHILNAELKQKGLGNLGSRLDYPYASGLLVSLGRYIRQRYAENTDVKTLAHAANSQPIPFENVRAGDFFVRVVKAQNERDHVMLVTKTDGQTIYCAQSEARPSDGRLGHGVREDAAPDLSSFEARRLNCLA